MTTHNGSSKTRVTLADQIKVADFLKDEKVLKVIDTNPQTCMYLMGWTDEKVANHLSSALNIPLTKHNVSGIREQVYGKTAVRHTNPDQGELQLAHDKLLERIEVMNGVIDAMGNKMAAMEIRIGAIELKIKHG